MQPPPAFQPEQVVLEPRMDIAPPPTLAVVVPVEMPLAASHHKSFMSTKPPQFMGREGPDKAKEWLEKVEKALYIMEIPVRLWVRFSTYILVGDAKAWWKTLLEVKYGREEPVWEEFVDQFRQTYIPKVVKERMHEFLELVQGGR